MKLKQPFGTHLIDDVYGRSINVGSVVDEVYRAGTYLSLSRNIAYGLTGGGNLQIIRLWRDSADIVGGPITRANKGWLVSLGLTVAPEIPLPKTQYMSHTIINDYHEAPYDHQETMFMGYIGGLK